MIRNLRIDQLAQMRPEAFVRALLSGFHQTRIAHHIGGEDRSEAAGGGGRGHGSGGANSRAQFNLFRAETRELHTAGRGLDDVAYTDSCS